MVYLLWKDGADIDASSLFSCAVRAGSVRNIIQQFENSSDSVEDGDIEGQRLSSSSFGEDSMDRSVYFIH